MDEWDSWEWPCVSLELCYKSSINHDSWFLGTGCNLRDDVDKTIFQVSAKCRVKKLSCVWEKRREWALNRRRQKGGQKVWIMKIKPVIAITLEALASFVSVISDTVSCPVVFFTRLKLENSLYLWSHEICSAYKWHISLWYKTRWRIENLRPTILAQ